MHRSIRLHRLIGVAALAIVAGVAGPATGASAANASSGHAGAHRVDDGRHAVFVMTDAVAGNQVVVFDADHDGALTLAGQYATGGDGGVAEGAAVDSLASEGSLAYDPAHRLLFAVNAGSGTLSVFGVRGDRLTLHEVIGTFGTFPDSVAVSGDLVYVLNAAGSGSVQGFRITGGFVLPIAPGGRSLGLDNTDPPNYLASPGQVGFAPDGRFLVVTTKMSGSDIDLFRVRANGSLSTPVVNPSATPVPFGFTFDAAGRLVVAEAGASEVSTYAVGRQGRLHTVASLADGQQALCWITSARGVDYVANAGSADISGYRVDGQGRLSLVTATGVVAHTGAGSIDLAASADGRTLYAEAGGAGQLDVFTVHGDGSLSPLQVVTADLGPGLEGLAVA